MKQPEQLKPDRSYYDNDLDYMMAVAVCIQEYEKKMLRYIDATTDRTHTFRHQAAFVQDIETLHDYLQKHPLLLARYKTEGVAALFEI
jgi:hypothetical protein